MESKEVQKLVKEWQNYITENFYPCTKEILAGLAVMYVEDERFRNNINRYSEEDLADFFAKAIAVYTK